MNKAERSEKAKRFAFHEIEWWKSHHRKEKEKLLYNMAKVEMLRSGISYSRGISLKEAEEATRYKVRAALEHDMAEFHEDAGRQEEAKVYWDNAEKLLEKHFKVLLKYAE